MTSREFKYHRYKKQQRFDFNWDIPTNKRICENEGCSHYASVKCELDYQDQDTEEWKTQTEWFCCEHANEGGYCMGCGTFIAGTGMEYTNNGYCDNCWDEIRSNEIDDEEYFSNGSLDY